MGINANTIISVTFVIGAALAAVAGVMVSAYYGLAHYHMGFILGLKAFTAAVLGGIGNIAGAMLGGLVSVFLSLCAPLRAPGPVWRAVPNAFRALAAVSLLALAPAAAHNWRAEGAFIPVSANGGGNSRCCWTTSIWTVGRSARRVSAASRTSTSRPSPRARN